MVTKNTSFQYFLISFFFFSFLSFFFFFTIFIYLLFLCVGDIFFKQKIIFASISGPYDRICFAETKSFFPSDLTLF